MAEPTNNEASVDEAFVQDRTIPQYLGVTLRGVFMGGADVIPGVSGGTMALILGIYKELIASIRSFDVEALKLLLRRDIRGFIKHTNLIFVLFLVGGIGSAIISLAKVMPKLLKQYPEPTKGLFFGLVLASIFIVLKQIEKHTAATLLSLALSAVGAYFIVGLIPGETSNAYWFIFVAGAIAIMAMILPGLSGAFLLLVLGKYEFILNALTRTLKGAVVAVKTMNFSALFNQDLAVVCVFCLGCLTGLMAFSRFLNWLLKHYEPLTLAILTGLMLGSLRKIWPFQDIVTKVIRKKERIIRYTNQWPSEWQSKHFLAIGLLITGVLLVFALDYVASKKKPSKAQ